MYEYQDEKVKLQLEYDKLLQKYQVELAAFYTIPIGLFFSVLSMHGYNSIIAPTLSENHPMVQGVIVFMISLILFFKLLDSTQNKIRKIPFTTRDKDSFRFDITLPKWLMLQNEWTDTTKVHITATKNKITLKRSND